jgi:peptide methionine sulfoxide reductase MsrB
VDESGTTVFYDSVTGVPLFEAPIGRSFEDFKKESMAHGWPSFRDEEVNWDYVRVLSDGEAVSTSGTHLGHNLPDKNGNRCGVCSVAVIRAWVVGHNAVPSIYGVMLRNVSPAAPRYCINLVSVAGTPEK